MLSIGMKQAQVDALPEYSCSLPTGVITGKQWKRDANAYIKGAPPAWKLGEYMPPDEQTKIDGTIKIRWYRIVITDVPD